MAEIAPPIVSLIAAKWVAPMNGPMLQGSAVAVCDGDILSVGPTREMRGRFPNASIEDLGDAVILPGLINAHVHLELSALTPGEKPASFGQWLRRLLPKSPPEAQAVQVFVERGISIGVGQCLKFGVTAVGDISRQSAITRPLLANGPLNTVSFGEVQAMAQRRGFLEDRIRAAADPAYAGDSLRIGISPHAPYSVEMDGYRRCLAAARAAGLPIATHLAETLSEAGFLGDHTGEFRELWRYLDAWDDAVPTFSGGPVRYAKAVGLLDYPTLLAHVNYCDDAEMKLLAEGKASVVYCPRTHEYFGHPPHRWQQMLADGINVAIGTDSCASSPDLNLVDDLRLVHRLAPDVPVDRLWEMATCRAARAIGWEDRRGSLNAGKAADLVAFATVGDEPLCEILESQLSAMQVWIGGTRQLHQ